jgi:hydrophobic/amphiphilic exporter-1 (mainly G- bacteria), HAE1 family
MNISQPFILRPIATSLLMLGLVLVGSVAYRLLPVAPLPQVDFPTIAIEASLPGASAETMAASVATPIERSLSDISGVTSMISSSSLGTTAITIQFELNRSIDAAAQDVQTAINAAGGSLPKNLPNPPTYHKVNPADFTIMSVALTSETQSLTELDRYADDFLARQISQISGVGLVDFHGEQKPAIRVQINPDNVAELGLSLEDVRALLAAATVNAPKGNLDGPDRSLVLDATDQVFSAEAYKRLIVAYKNGAPIRIGDLGTVVDGPEDAKEAAWLQGERTIIIDIHKQPGFNVVETIQRIKDRLPVLTASLPPSIAVRVVGDRTQTIKASVSDVQRTLSITVGLVVLVIFAFLRNFWATVIPAITIPLSLVATFGAMYLLGYSVDNLSLMGLTIAVGFVVDDAIVMIENVVRYIEAGDAPLEAALKGSREVGFTIVSMTISLIAVFIPVLLMSGVIGRLFREFAMTVGAAVIASGIISLTVTPMMCAKFLRRHGGEAHGSLYRGSERVFDWALEFYARGLRWVLRHQPLMLLAMLVTLAATVYCYAIIPKGFFPQEDTGLIIGVAEAAPDISFKAMADRIQALGRIVIADPDVDNAYYWIGPNPTLSQGRMLINLKPASERSATAYEIVARLKPKVAKVEGVALFMQVRQDIQVGGRPSKTQYQYTLQDGDSSELAQWAPIAQKALTSLPELQDVTADIQASAPRATLRIDRDTASRLGVSTQAIDDTLYDAFGQRQVATVFTQLNQYHVVLELDPRFQMDASALRHLYVHSATSGQLVPMSMFTAVEDAVAPITINHQGLFPSVTLSFNLAPGHALGEAVSAIQVAERKLAMPKGLVTSFQGTAQEFQRSLQSQPYLIAAAIIAVYIVLGILYESYIHPLTILSTLPSAGVGALLALMLFKRDLSIIGLIGIILLIGIVKKNAIMMIDFALQAERQEKMAPQESIYQACLLRFRPIMMTTMATLLGALPLAFGTGVGAELRQPLGITIVGGLLLSQILTLYTTPVTYLYLGRLSRAVGGWAASDRWRRSAPAPTRSEPAARARETRAAE